MPGKNYNYAYQNIRTELEGIRNTLRHMQNNNVRLGPNLETLRKFTLDEKISENTNKTLLDLHQLFIDILPTLSEGAEYSLLKLRIERLDEPDLENFIKDIKGDFIRDIEEEKDVVTEEAPQIVYQQEYNEEYGTIMRPYQLINGELHPCRLERDGHVTLIGDDSDS